MFSDIKNLKFYQEGLDLLLYPKVIQNLILQMLVSNPEQRIKPEDVLAHQYFSFAGLNKKKLAKKGGLVKLGHTINNQH